MRETCDVCCAENVECHSDHRFPKRPPFDGDAKDKGNRHFLCVSCHTRKNVLENRIATLRKFDKDCSDAEWDEWLRYAFPWPVPEEACIYFTRRAYGADAAERLADEPC